MLVIEQSSRLLVITQSDHARLAHDMLALWRRDELPEAPWRAELLRAVAEHDNGWWEEDSAPFPAGDTGWPCDFRAYPEEHRRGIWRRAVERYADREADVAYLVLLHARRLHEASLERPEWRDFAAFLDERQEQLEEMVSHRSSDLRAAYEFLWLADSLSLDGCGVWGARRRSWRDYEISASLGHVRLRPLPLAGKTTVRVRYREIAKRRYAGELDLGTELATARWQSLNVTVEALDEP